jgi:hypothetical protein
MKEQEMPIFLFMDSKNQALHEHAKNSVVQAGLQDHLMISHPQDINLFLKTFDFKPAKCLVLMDEPTLMKVDFADVPSHLKFIGLVERKISEIVALLPTGLDIDFLLAKELVQENELGKRMFQSSLRCILENSLPSFDSIVGAQHKIERRLVTRTDEKNPVVEWIDTCIHKDLDHLPEPLRDSFAKKVAMVADELILNSIYDANPRMQGMARNTPEELKEYEEVEVKLAILPDSIALSVKDNFGTLRKETLMRYLSGQNVIEKISERKSGGLGLRLSLDSSTQLIIKVEAGTQTEIMSFAMLTPSLREFRQKVKSVLCFFKE